MTSVAFFNKWMFTYAELLHSAQYACCTGRKIELEPSLALLVQVTGVHGKVRYTIIIETHTAELYIVGIENVLVSALANHEAVVGI